jgi:hypothetical protein
MVQTFTNTLYRGGVDRMKCREFVYVGEPVPEITDKENADFLLHYQKSILASLKQRKLLNHSQYQRCIDELEKQYSRKKRSQA